MEPNEPVEAATFFSRIEADIARAHLESVGIKSFVQADDAVEPTPAWSSHGRACS
jgi:hypothetical protein